MKTRRGEILSPGTRLVRWIISIILILYTFITISVLAITLMDSLKSKGDLITNFAGLPKEITLDSFRRVLTEDNFIRYFGNSLILTVCGTLGCILLSAMTAYGIARYLFRGKTILTVYLLVGMMVPIQVSILPVFLILKNMRLLNNLLGLILVYVSGISMSCFVFQKFFQTIPVALEESARLDGAGDYQIFFKIVLPICKPVLFTMGLITAIGQWNDFYMPMVLLGNKHVKTLTLTIYQYIGQFAKHMSESMAAVIITLIPVIVIYFLFSSQIVEGLSGGAVKE